MNAKQKKVKWLNEATVVTYEESLKFHQDFIKLGKIFSEAWVVTYTYKNPIGDIVITGLAERVPLFTVYKNMQNQVEVYFKKHYPGATIISIQYQ